MFSVFFLYKMKVECLLIFFIIYDQKNIFYFLETIFLTVKKFSTKNVIKSI